MQAQVADLGQNPMQSGLVLDWAGDQGLAVPQGGQRQALKPATPVAVQQTSDTNLVLVQLGGSACRVLDEGPRTKDERATPSSFVLRRSSSVPNPILISAEVY
jgi:hypothetical protein